MKSAGICLFILKRFPCVRAVAALGYSMLDNIQTFLCFRSFGNSNILGTINTFGNRDTFGNSDTFGTRDTFGANNKYIWHY